MDSFTLTRVAGLDNPDVSPRVGLLQLLVVIHEVPVLVWQDVSIREKVIILPPKLLLHLHVIKAKPIFPGDFVGIWKVVNSLILIQTLV